MKCALCNKNQPCPNHGRTPVTDKDFEELSKDIQKMSEPQIDPNKRYIGNISRIDDKKGYGFILTKQIPFTRIFFHWSALDEDTAHFLELNKGDEVEFNVIEVEDRDNPGVMRKRAIKIIALESDVENK